MFINVKKGSGDSQEVFEEEVVLELNFAEWPEFPYAKGIGSKIFSGT